MAIENILLVVRHEHPGRRDGFHDTARMIKRRTSGFRPQSRRPGGRLSAPGTIRPTDEHPSHRTNQKCWSRHYIRLNARRR